MEIVLWFFWSIISHLQENTCRYTDVIKSGYRIKLKGVHTVGDKKNGILALFSHKMAFLKSKFKDDPVRVQRHTVRHFKDLE